MYPTLSAATHANSLATVLATVKTLQLVAAAVPRSIAATVAVTVKATTCRHPSNALLGSASLLSTA